MQAFTDLVGTAVVPAHCFDTDELTDLTPALDTAASIQEIAGDASGAAYTNMGSPICRHRSVAPQASESAGSGTMCWGVWMLTTE